MWAIRAADDALLLNASHELRFMHNPRGLYVGMLLSMWVGARARPTDVGDEWRPEVRIGFLPAIDLGNPCYSDALLPVHCGKASEQKIDGKKGPQRDNGL
jgi:hypothetical protein